MQRSKNLKCEMELSDILSCILMMGSLYYSLTTSTVKLFSKKKKKAKRRRYWVHPLNTIKRRREQGDHHNLIREMRFFDHSRFIQHLRMTPQIYDKLLSLVTPLIEKDDGVREPIDPGTRLEITLR